MVRNVRAHIVRYVHRPEAVDRRKQTISDRRRFELERSAVSRASIGRQHRSIFRNGSSRQPLPRRRCSRSITYRRDYPLRLLLLRRRCFSTTTGSFAPFRLRFARTSLIECRNFGAIARGSRIERREIIVSRKKSGIAGRFLKSANIDILFPTLRFCGDPRRGSENRLSF